MCATIGKRSKRMLLFSGKPRNQEGLGPKPRAHLTMSTTLDDLQDRWPVFSSILVDYFAASPGARRGRKGDDATFLTRFSAVGGEKSPEFNGLHAELTGLIQRPGEASDLLNLTFGYVDATGSPDRSHPGYIDRPQARSLITGLLSDLYTTDEEGDGVDEEEGLAGFVDVRAQAFDEYRRYTLFHLPARTPGRLPPWASRHGSRALAGMAVPAPVAAAVGAALAAAGWGISQGLQSLNMPDGVVLPLSWPFLLGGLGLLIWAVSAMLLVRSSIINPPTEEDEEEEKETAEKKRAKSKARRNILRNLRS